jgi:integrase/recombinase XerD
MAGMRKFPDRGDPADPQGFLALRADCEEALRIANYSSRTVETFSARLRPFIFWCATRGLTRPRSVTRTHLVDFQRWMFHYRKDDGHPLDPSTQKLVVGSLKLFFRLLARRGCIPANPAAELEYPKAGLRLPRAVLSHAEVERALATASPSTLVGLRDRTVLEVLYSTAIRRMELEGLGLDDLNTAQGTLFIRKAKGDRQRVVPVGERALSWLERYLREGRVRQATNLTERALFLNKNGRRLSKRAVSALGKKILRRANLGRAGAAHVFRHSAATAMLDGGADVRYVQELLGHASLLSTQVYTRVSISRLKAVHAATHPGARLSGRSLDHPARRSRSLLSCRVRRSLHNREQHVK